MKKLNNTVWGIILVIVGVVLALNAYCMFGGIDIK